MDDAYGQTLSVYNNSLHRAIADIGVGIEGRNIHAVLYVNDRRINQERR